jgi:hypothetical protein
MNERVLERRMLLRSAGVAGATMVGVAAVPATADARGSVGDSRVLGSWLITHQDAPPGDTTRVLAVVGFAAGGVLTSQDVEPASPGGLGAWTGHGDSFTGTFYIGQPAHGSKQPAVIVKVDARGRVNGGSIKGTYQFTVYDAKTHKRVTSGHGRFSGGRIKV